MAIDLVEFEGARWKPATQRRNLTFVCDWAGDVASLPSADAATLRDGAISPLPAPGSTARVLETGEEYALYTDLVWRRIPTAEWAADDPAGSLPHLVHINGDENVTFAVTDASSAAVEDGDTVNYGDVLTLAITAAAGYSAEVTANGVKVAAGNYTVTTGMDLTFNVVSTPLIYDLTVQVDANTGVTVTRGGLVIATAAPAASKTYTFKDLLTYGDEVQVIPIYAAGYEKNALTVGGAAYTAGEDATVGAADVAVVATAKAMPRLTVDADDYSTILCTGPARKVYESGDYIPHGTALTITLSTAATHVNSIFTINGVNYLSPAFITTATGTDILIVAAADSGKITYKDGLTTLDALPRYYEEGVETAVSAGVAKTGYAFDGWYTASNFTGDAVTAIADTETGDVILYAKYTALKYALARTETGATVTVTVGGAAVLDGADKITHATTMTVTAVADETGTSITTLKLNGADITSGDTHVVAGPVSIEAAATADPYDLARTGDHVTITVTRDDAEVEDGENVVAYGEVLTITATPETGYDLTALAVNSEAFTSGEEHTVGAADVAIAATTAASTYDLARTATDATVTVTKNGTAQLDGTGVLGHGDTLVITATPAEAHTLTTFTVNDVAARSPVTVAALSDIAIAATGTAS